MRRLIAGIIAPLALAGGLAIGPMATPASAHHTHSPYTYCSQARPSGYTLIGYWSSYDSSGHPLRAYCQYRNNATFATICVTYSYYYHTGRYC